MQTSVAGIAPPFLEARESMPSQQSEIAVIKSELQWHFRVGSAAIAIFIGLFVWFFTTYLPKELEHQKTDIVNEIQLKLDQITKLQLDKVSAQISAAKASGMALDPKVVSRLGSAVLDIAKSKHPELQNASWNVMNQLLGYYSSIITPTAQEIERHGFLVRGKDQDQECIGAGQSSGIVMQGAIFEHCTQHLDEILGPSAVGRGLFFEYMIFRDVRVIYKGGPLRMREVYFINCTFELQPSPGSELLARTFLAVNHVPQLQLP